MNELIYEKREGVAYFTLNRPKQLNALNDDLNRALWESWADFNRDDHVDVAILTGSGSAFCAGADLKTYIPKWYKRTPEMVRENVKTGIGGGITRGQHKIFKPIIAAINGPALAGGFELALACDIRVASKTAKFGSFEARVGFHHADGGMARLVNLVGYGVSLDLCLTAREVDSDEALRLGLITQVVEPGKLMERALACAVAIRKNSQAAVRSAKQTIYEVIGEKFDQALEIDAIRGYSSGDISDIQNRIQAVLAETPKPEH